MPRKTKYYEKDILEAALDVVCRHGMKRLSTRSIAKKLNCSTMPVYSFMKSKKNLEEKIIQMAYERLYQYQTTSRTGDVFLDMGVGYVIFALREKQLFRCINDELHVATLEKYNEKHFDLLIQKLSEYEIVKEMSPEAVRKFFMQGWIYSHGLATLVNIGYYGELEENEICELFIYTGRRYIEGFQRLKQTS